SLHRRRQHRHHADRFHFQPPEVQLLSSSKENSMAENIVIVGAKRTPIGSMQGKFNSMSASQLGAVAIKAAVEQSGVKVTEIDDVIFGNVAGAGQGQAPARQAALGAGLDKSTPATTINKMCGSGMKAAMMAAHETSVCQTRITA